MDREGRMPERLWIRVNVSTLWRPSVFFHGKSAVYGSTQMPLDLSTATRSCPMRASKKVHVVSAQLKTALCQSGCVTSRSAGRRAEPQRPRDGPVAGWRTNQARRGRPANDIHHNSTSFIATSAAFPGTPPNSNSNTYRAAGRSAANFQSAVAVDYLGISVGLLKSATGFGNRLAGCCCDRFMAGVEPPAAHSNLCKDDSRCT